MIHHVPSETIKGEQYGKDEFLAICSYRRHWVVGSAVESRPLPIGHDSDHQVLPRQYQKTHDPTPPHPTPHKIKKPTFETCLEGLGVWKLHGKIIRVDLSEFIWSREKPGNPQKTLFDLLALLTRHRFFFFVPRNPKSFLGVKYKKTRAGK